MLRHCSPLVFLRNCSIAHPPKFGVSRTSSISNSSLLLLPLLLIVIITVGIVPTTAAATHDHHQQQHRHNQQQQQQGQVVPEDQQQQDDQRQQQRLLELPFDEEQGTTTTPAEQGKDLFREYLSRGMFTCSTKYVAMLQKLNKLIASAHAEYSQCQKLVAKADREHRGKQLQEQLDMINEMLME